MRKWKLPSADGDQERNQGWNPKWNQSGNQKQKTKRDFGCRVARGMLALLCSAALVLSDALPVPGGVPDAVSAAGPSKGTITFYKWTRLREWDDLSGGGYVMLIHKQDGNYYMSQSVTDINNGQSHWISKSIDMDPRIDPESDEFLTRTNWSNIRTRKTTFNGKYSAFDGFYIYEYKNGNYYYVSHTTEYLHYATDVATLWIPYDRSMGDSGKGFEMRFGTINNNTVWLRPKSAGNGLGVRLDWDGWTGSIGSWEVYSRSTKTFTCINKDYTIGENQVYVADADLFLKEDVKLTIPEGSVLCVKNGPFYVNGEIECYGTILVEDGGIIMPMESTSGGSRIVMKEGGAMIIRSGGKVYAGCPKGSLGTKGDNGWLDMYAGSSIINFGLLVVGKSNLTYGQATIENHKGGAMYLGYSIAKEKSFLRADLNNDFLTKLKNSTADVGQSLTNGGTYYGKGANTTVLKTWEGAVTMLANRASGSNYGQTIKLYSYDKNGKCTVISSYSP
jgi:hypothetical protein